MEQTCSSDTSDKTCNRGKSKTTPPQKREWLPETNALSSKPVQNTSHPLRDGFASNSCTFGETQKCTTEQHRTSFLPVAISLHTSSTWKDNPFFVVNRYYWQHETVPAAPVTQAFQLRYLYSAVRVWAQSQQHIGDSRRLAVKPEEP